jgi:hypothetical protein
VSEHPLSQDGEIHSQSEESHRRESSSYGESHGTGSRTVTERFVRDHPVIGPIGNRERAGTPCNCAGSPMSRGHQGPCGPSVGHMVSYMTKKKMGSMTTGLMIVLKFW